MSFSSDVALLSNQLPISIDLEPEKPEFQEQLNLAIKRITDSINTKEGALYLLQELATFKQIYNLNPGDVYTLSVNRNVYRKTFDLVKQSGGLVIPPGAYPAFNHEISNLFNAVLIYASCTSDEASPQYFTVVYPNIILNQTQILFTNPLVGINLKNVIIVAEYTKN